MLNKMAISKFWSGDFGKIISVGGGLGALHFFRSLKRALELSISVRMSLSRHSRTTGSIRSPQGKNKQTNKHASVIYLLAKNTKFHIFVDGSLKLLQ